jgi:hypothetical protein
MAWNEEDQERCRASEMVVLAATPGRWSVAYSHSVTVTFINIDIKPSELLMVYTSRADLIVEIE